MQLKRKTKLIIFGIIIVIIGIIIGIIPLFFEKAKVEKENTKVKEYINNTSNSLNKSIDSNEDINYSEMLLVLEIPKIGLKRVVYKLDSDLNTIEKNIEIMKESSLPTEDNGNVILEGHNGNSDISYFNQLHKLNESDLAYIYYQGTKYIYSVDKIYDVEKDGYVEVTRNKDKNTLTLITCKRNTQDRQLVLIFYLREKQKY